jgi:hypothetical protein
MDLSGDRLLIVNAVQVASVHTRNAGVWTATTAPDPGGLAVDDVFGSSVALDVDVVLGGPQKHNFKGTICTTWNGLSC